MGFVVYKIRSAKKIKIKIKNNNNKIKINKNKRLKLANPVEIKEKLKSTWPTSGKADPGSKKRQVPSLRRTLQKE